MRKAFFLIFLFTLLLRGIDQVYDGRLIYTTCYLADQEFRKIQKGREDKSGEDQASFETTSTQSYQQALVYEEIGENDPYNFARKYKLLTGYHAVPTGTFFQNYLYGCLRDRLPDGSNLYCKYITQRALRI